MDEVGRTIHHRSPKEPQCPAFRPLLRSTPLLQPRGQCSKPSKSNLAPCRTCFELISNSPASLESYLGLSDTLSKGTLPAATRERIALAVAEVNGCNYCLSAHTYLGKNLAKLDDAEISANRNGASNDPKADAAIRFAVKVVREHGHVSEDDLRAVKSAGYDNAQVIEIVLHVALNTWTNYINEVAKTDIDFPVVTPRKAA